MVDEEGGFGTVRKVDLKSEARGRTIWRTYGCAKKGGLLGKVADDSFIVYIL